MEEQEYMEMVNEDREKTSDRVLQLDATLKNQFERAFGTDFSDVRIHIGANAEKMARESGAKAVTIGNDIYFGGGQYAPDTEAGVHLLAHELQHVVQYQQNQRMTYLEDVAELEQEAYHIESRISNLQLHNIDMPLLNLNGAPSSVATESSSLSGAGALNRDADDAQVTDRLDNFTKRKDKPSFRYHSKSGKVFNYDSKAYEQIKKSVKQRWASHMEQMRMTMTEEEYAAYITKFINYTQKKGN